MGFRINFIAHYPSRFFIVSNKNNDFSNRIEAFVDVLIFIKEINFDDNK